MAVDYRKIYDYLDTRKGKLVTASMIAFFTGTERVYGATMSKLVRDGIITPSEEKGYYRVKD